jgi:hypothetical protein
MNTENKDIATLLELLKMGIERWPQPETDELTQSELFRRDRSLFEMWPEACRRTGVGKRQFPHGVIKLWKQRMGGAH